MEIYCLDFDQTLGIVPQSFDEDMMAYYARITGAPLELINQFEPAPHSILDQLRQMQELGLDFPLEATIEKVKTFLDEEFRSILYSDSIATINELKNRGARIAIATYGGSDYQNAKLTATGIRELADDVHVTQNPFSKGRFIAKLAKQYEGAQIVHVDDREGELDGVRLDHQDQSLSKYNVIHSLNELI
jgi:FMN phosphatase YigB (HAD superfamily)